MNAARIYALCLTTSDEQRLSTQAQALGYPQIAAPEECSAPGLLFLGDASLASYWQSRGHSVIVCGRQGAYSIDDAIATLTRIHSSAFVGLSERERGSSGGDEASGEDEGGRDTFFFGEVLDPLIRHQDVSDILVNGTKVWVDCGKGLRDGECEFGNLQDVRRLAIRIAAYCGRRLDEASPIVDASLPSGIRLHAVLPPVALDGPLISLRLPRRNPLLIRDMCVGASEEFLTRFVHAVVQRRMNCLISGATGSGKTTLLSAVLGVVPANQRMVCIEEVCELRPVHPHVVHLQERTPNVQGAGGVSLSELVRAAVRMRPDRIIVGECRGAEVRDMLMAFNTGHDGGWATIHANNVQDVPARLRALGSLGGMGGEALAMQVRAAFHLVIHVQRGKDGRRRIAQVGVVEGKGENLVCRVGLTINEDGQWCQGAGWERLQALVGADVLGGR